MSKVTRWQRTATDALLLPLGRSSGGQSGNGTLRGVPIKVLHLTPRGCPRLACQLRVARPTETRVPNETGVPGGTGESAEIGVPGEMRRLGSAG